MPSSASSRSASLRPSIAIIALAAAATLFTYYLSLPPSPLPADAPAEAFSAYRALEHDKAIASVPHPGGSRANEKVRDYIVDQMKALGIEVEVDYCHGAFGVGAAENVIARIPGTANTKAFAMEAHYDSVPYGPGAADDCAGVVAMIEAARALKAAPPLINDIIFVFSDMEEGGLLGAKAFTEHPWAKNVGVMLNFEARGTAGPSYMFETSEENGWLIAQLAQAPGVSPRATSVMYDVYKPLPFSSDFSHLRKRGIKGLNVAFIDRFCHYHTRDDKPENLSLASLQQHGAYALGLARHFGSIPLDNVTAPDATYFNTLGSHMVHYPLAWGKKLVALAAFVLALTLVIGFARKHLTPRGIIAGIGVFLLTLVAGMAIVAALEGISFLIYGHYMLYHNNLYGVAFGFIAAGVATFILLLLVPRVGMQNLTASALIIWFVFLVATEFYLPGGAYLILWPLVFACFAAAILFLFTSREEPSPKLIAVLTLFLIPGIALFVPSMAGFQAVMTVLASFIISGFLILLMGLGMPQLSVVLNGLRGRFPATCTVIGLVLLIAALATNGASATKPRYSCLSYGLDLDKGAAYWLSNDKAPDEWTSQFFPEDAERAPIPEFIPRDQREYMRAPAPTAQVAPPELSLISDEVSDGERTLVLNVKSPREVPIMYLRVTPGATVHEAEVLGHTLPGSDKGWSQRVKLFPRGGLDWRLVVDPGKPLHVNLIEESFGIPVFPGTEPRPDYLIPEPNTTLDFGRPLRSERTFVTKTFAFPPK